MLKFEIRIFASAEYAFPKIQYKIKLIGCYKRPLMPVMLLIRAFLKTSLFYAFSLPIQRQPYSIMFSQCSVSLTGESMCTSYAETQNCHDI